MKKNKILKHETSEFYDPQQLNEEEFESISVLRNPSSISQYGNEGKNGVILITTKTGLKGNLKNKSDEIKVFEYSAKEGLNGDVYYKKIEDGTVNGYGNNKAETNLPVKVTNVPIKVSNVPKSDKIKVTSKTSLDTLVFSSPSGSRQVIYSNVTLITKDKQKVLDALVRISDNYLLFKTNFYEKNLYFF